MNSNFFTFLFIPALVLTFMGITRYIRQKFAKPKVESEIQTPGRFDRLIKTFLTIVTVLTGLLSVVGFIAQAMAMAIAFLVITLIFGGCVLILNHAYDMSYQENEEFFTLTKRNKEVTVYYKDIVDWIPSPNEIWVLDESKEGNKYIKVNIAILKPEILLRKITEMTFNGEMKSLDQLQMEQELIEHLNRHHYGHLVEDYLDTTNS